MENDAKRGGISVETAHIFPVIKKWLYSEKDIFLREIVSNAADAVTKHKRLVSLGEIPSDEDVAYRIEVKLDKAAKTLTVVDNGVGMTEDELIKYLGNIALSGAVDFIEKYEAATDTESTKNGIIGHFGLGFYSSFMVADTVEVITKSYTNAPAVHWVCTADGAYEIYESNKSERGTEMIMHISDGEEEYLEKTKILSMLDKYCSFMPTEIYFEDVEDEEKKDSVPAPVNDTTPLWQRPASECTDEDYKEFYRKVFSDYREPLFWIHINADYPLNFKGILYFPQLSNEYESIEGEVKLYYNQVFVADNIKEVMPEYLFMLKGVLDCPELPLNVSRSYLQNNTYVSKVSAHIAKKVADKLNGMLNNDRENYEKIWDSIRTFVEYACMRDKKFYERTKNSLLLRLTDGTSMTVSEYLDAAREKHEGKVYYTTDKEAQAQYVSLFEAEGVKVALLDRAIDTQFVQMMESYTAEVKYMRIDADVADILGTDGDGTTENTSMTELFCKASGDEKLTVKYQSLKDGATPAMLTVSEESRRMSDMMKMYAMQSGGDMPDFPIEYTLTVNTSSKLYSKMCELLNTDEAKAQLIASQIYDLSLLSQRKLTADELSRLLSNSFDILSQL